MTRGGRLARWQRVEDGPPANNGPSIRKAQQLTGNASSRIQPGLLQLIYGAENAADSPAFSLLWPIGQITALLHKSDKYLKHNQISRVAPKQAGLR